MDTPVVRLGAWCDIVTEDEARQRLLAEAADDGSEGGDAHVGPAGGWAAFVPRAGVPVLSPGVIHFRVEEFAVLADGRRVRLHAERGFVLSAERGFGLSAERGFGLSAGVDPWQYLTLEWLSGLLRVQGIEASTEELRGLPYDVEFSDRLRVRVSAEA